MGMKMVIDNEAVISRMSLQNIQEVRDAIDSTLIAAHAVMQASCTPRSRRCPTPNSSF